MFNLFKQWPTQGAILLVGDSQEKQQTLAVEYAKKLLCQNSTQSNALFEANTHTDFRLISPESDSKQIKIDQIRELIDWARGRPQMATQKVAVLSPAHLMNLQAANALLKTLEEASVDMLFILVTTQPFALLATIRSRCYWLRDRSIENPLPESPLKNRVLENLKALENKQQDPLSIVQEWIKQDPKEILACLLFIFSEALHHKVLEQGGVPSSLKNPQGWLFYDQLLSAKCALEELNPPNIQLMFETLLMEYKAPILL
jgi:DNA polymerase III, delta subunit